MSKSSDEVEAASDKIDKLCNAITKIRMPSLEKDIDTIIEAIDMIDQTTINLPNTEGYSVFHVIVFKYMILELEKFTHFDNGYKKMIEKLVMQGGNIDNMSINVRNSEVLDIGTATAFATKCCLPKLTTLLVVNGGNFDKAKFNRGFSLNETLASFETSMAGELLEYLTSDSSRASKVTIRQTIQQANILLTDLISIISDYLAVPHYDSTIKLYNYLIVSENIEKATKQELMDKFSLPLIETPAAISTPSEMDVAGTTTEETSEA